MVQCESRSASSPDVRRYIKQARSEAGFAMRPLAAPSRNRLNRAFIRNLFLLTALMLMLGTGRKAQAQISPGPLSQPHHQFDAPGNCPKCHTQSVRERTLSFNDCHKEIAAEMQQH